MLAPPAAARVTRGFFAGARSPNASRAGTPQWGQKETVPDTLPPQREQVAGKIGPCAV